MIFLSIFDLLLLPSRMVGLFISWCEALLHSSNTSLKNLKIFAQLHEFLVYFWFAAAALRDGGPAYFMVQSTPLCEQPELENLKICALLHAFLVYFLSCCFCPQGWRLVYFMVQSTPSCEQSELEKIENLFTIAYFLCLFLDILLLPSKLAGLFISWCKEPLHASNLSLKILKSLHHCMLSLSIFWLDAASLKAGGPVYFMVRSTSSCEQPKLEKMKIFTLLHDFLVYLLPCCCCPLAWWACLFHDAKHSFMWAKRARKIENLCSITWFPCLLFDLLLLPSGMGGLFISWCEAPLHASNVS